MGSFGGHALPGSFFIAFAIYWSFMFYRRLFASRRKGSPPFRATVTFRCDGCRSRRCANIEWEGIFKIFFTVVGFAGEMITGSPGGRFIHFGNGQHATMFFFFGLSGAVDILAARRSPLLPTGSEYFFGVLAFTVETVLFMFHLHGRTPMDVMVHTQLLYVLYVSIIIILLEAWFRNAILVFARILIIMVQGTWFWQVGFILYNPFPGAERWNEEDHTQMMIVTMMFCWHLAASATVMISIGAFVYCVSYRSEHYGLMHNDPEEPQRYGSVRQAVGAIGATTVDEYHDELDSDTEHVHLNSFAVTAAS